MSGADSSGTTKDLDESIIQPIIDDAQTFINSGTTKACKSAAKKLLANAAINSGISIPRLVLLARHNRTRHNKKAKILMMFFDYNPDVMEQLRELKDGDEPHDVYWGSYSYPCWCAVVTEANELRLMNDIFAIFQNYFEKVIDVDAKTILSFDAPADAYDEAPAYRLLPHSYPVSIDAISNHFSKAFPDKGFCAQYLYLLMGDTFKKAPIDDFFTQHPFLVFRISGGPRYYYFYWSTVGQYVDNFCYPNSNPAKVMLARAKQAFSLSGNTPVVSDFKAPNSLNDFGIPHDAQKIIDSVLLDFPVAVLNSNYVDLVNSGCGGDLGVNHNTGGAYVFDHDSKIEHLSRIAAGLGDKRISDIGWKKLNPIVFSDAYLCRLSQRYPVTEDFEYQFALILLHEVAHILARIQDAELCEENSGHGPLWSCYYDALVHIYSEGEGDLGLASIQFGYTTDPKLIEFCDDMMGLVVADLTMEPKAIAVSELIHSVSLAHLTMFAYEKINESGMSVKDYWHQQKSILSTLKPTNQRIQRHAKAL